MNVDTQQLELFAAMADLLIPPAAGMPSASQAGVVTQGLRAVLAARPELEPVLSALLQTNRGQNANEFLSRLRTSDAAGFGALTEAIAGAYFMNPDVRAALGYAGQTPVPVDHHEEIDPALLKPVVERGPIYRPTCSENPLRSS